MKKLLIGLFLTISIFGFSQTGEKNFIDQNYIEVIGKAEMEIVPDMIYLKIVLSEKDNKNKQSIEDIEKSMIQKLTDIGINVSNDLSVKDFVSNFKAYLIAKTDILLTKRYQLIVHDTKTLQKVFIELQKLGISNVNIEHLDHSKIDQFRKEIKIKAIKAAKDKAESLTVSLSQLIGRAIFIQELDNNNIPGAMQGRLAGANVLYKSFARDEGYASSTPEIEFEKINLQSAILVRFELK